MIDLDAEELFHLALDASEKGDRDKTLSYLKRSIELEPKATSIYILAAEYAEIGMMQRAIEGMQQAIELDPSLWTAHFQLGLLYLTQNLIQEARNAWSTLLELGPSEYIYYFALGLTQLVDEQTDDALASLQTGMEMNEANPALNRDIASIINNILSSDDEAGNDSDVDSISVASITSTPTAKEGNQHLFLSNYDDNADT